MGNVSSLRSSGNILGLALTRRASGTLMHATRMTPEMEPAEISLLATPPHIRIFEMPSLANVPKHANMMRDHACAYRRRRMRFASPLDGRRRDNMMPRRTIFLSAIDIGQQSLHTSGSAPFSWRRHDFTRHAQRLFPAPDDTRESRRLKSSRHAQSLSCHGR